MTFKTKEVLENERLAERAARVCVDHSQFFAMPYYRQFYQSRFTQLHTIREETVLLVNGKWLDITTFIDQFGGGIGESTWRMSYFLTPENKFKRRVRFRSTVYGDEFKPVIVDDRVKLGPTPEDDKKVCRRVAINAAFLDQVGARAIGVQWQIRGLKLRPRVTEVFYKQLR